MIIKGCWVFCLSLELVFKNKKKQLKSRIVNSAVFFHLLYETVSENLQQHLSPQMTVLKFCLIFSSGHQPTSPFGPNGHTSMKISSHAGFTKANMQVMHWLLGSGKKSQIILLSLSKNLKIYLTVLINYDSLSF